MPESAIDVLSAIQFAPQNVLPYAHTRRKPCRLGHLARLFQPREACVDRIRNL